jgi:hypothetical protein
MAGKPEANNFYHRTKALKKFFQWYEDRVRTGSTDVPAEETTFAPVGE